MNLVRVPETPVLKPQVRGTYEVRTYGCQMNVHDSERLTGLLALQILFSLKN